MDEKCPLCGAVLVWNENHSIWFCSRGGDVECDYVEHVNEYGKLISDSDDG